jgi:hypothetical protein
MSKVIPKTVLYAALWIVSTTCVANPSTLATVRSHDQPESPTHNSHKMKFVVYTNKNYRFRFSLPESWRGYSISLSEWQAGDGRTYQRGETIPPPEKGQLIVMRHPLWTESNPRQDIPIMIFTKTQWKLVEENRLFVSAAPIGPSEFGRNSKYVFALPPRHNYALPTGFEEVNEIIGRKSLRPF